MKKPSKTSVFVLSAVKCLIAVYLAGCRGGSGTPASERSIGSATFLLSGTSASGRNYRLRSAVFDVQGPQTKEIDGPTDPTDAQDTATASLVPGAYQITLRAGWRMFEVAALGAPVEVPAVLISALPMDAKIISGQDAAVIFQFQVAGETVPPGTLTIGIGVSPMDGGLPPDSSSAPDTPALPVIIPDTTRVTDDATRAALTVYDPTVGTMRFSQSTALLASLAPGDVLVSVPSDAAPSGYLRKIAAIRMEGAEVVLDTNQANLTEAVSQGALEGHVALTANDLQRTEVLFAGITISPSGQDASVPTGVAKSDLRARQLLGVGKNFDFEMRFNHVFLPLGGPGAQGQVTVDGSVKFNIGYGIQVGISGCFKLPPVCVDSFQASVGFDQSSDLSITGEASGQLGEEINIATEYYTPQVFFIGPLPVVVVPRMDLYLSAGGQIEAKVAFNASESAVAQVGARWTPDDGWRDISNFDFGGDVAPPTFSGAINPRAGAKTSMSLRLYDVAGPEISLLAGLELDGHIPRNPTWIVSGFLTGKLAFKVDLPIIGTLADYEATLFDLVREFARAGNATPTLTLTANARPDPNVFPAGTPRTVDLRVPVDLTPGCPGVLGGGIYYVAYDAEDGCGVGVTVVSDVDGPLPSKFAFQTVGGRLLTVTARDSQGASVTKRFALNVVNTPPTLTLRSSGNPVQGEGYPIVAQIADRNETDLGKLCASTIWTVDAPDTLASPTGCLQNVTFGTTGPRQVRVTSQDSDGASTSQMLSFNVLPPPENPYPRITSVTVGSREIRNSGDFNFCIVRSVDNLSTIDLTQMGCQIDVSQPAPNRYFVGAAVENPDGEALTYEWNLRATVTAPNSPSVDTEVYGVTSASPSFELVDFGNTGLATYGCYVTLKVNAPDPLRSKGPIPVWTGQCKFHFSVVR
jgi:hypothetical protein